jgi:FlaA1/EpsC-like NDP-sugar epimerase
MGCGETGQAVIDSLQANQQLGIRAVAAVDDDPDRWGYWQGVPVVGDMHSTRKIAETLGIGHLIVAIPSLPAETLQAIARDYGDVFEHIWG